MLSMALEDAGQTHPRRQTKCTASFEEAGIPTISNTGCLPVAPKPTAALPVPISSDPTGPHPFSFSIMRGWAMTEIECYWTSSGMVMAAGICYKDWSHIGLQKDSSS